MAEQENRSAEMADFDPSDLSQRPEGWLQHKARADGLKERADEMHAALKGLIRAAAHMSPFGSESSVKSVRLAGKYMAAVDKANAALAAYQPHDAGPGGPASEADSK